MTEYIERGGWNTGEKAWGFKECKGKIQGLNW